MWRRVQVVGLAAALSIGCENAPVTRPREETTAPTPVVIATDTVVDESVRFDGGAQDVASRAAQETRPETDLRPRLGLPHDHTKPVDHLARARALEDEGDLRGALLESRRAVHDDPESSAAHESAARHARASGDRALAKTAYVALADLVPTDPLPLLRLARIFLAEGDVASARLSASEALERDPGLAEAHHLRGRAELSASHLPAAIADFKRATELDSRHGHAFNNLGYAYLLANEPLLAVPPLIRAAELLPAIAYVHNNLGIAYEKTGRPSDARSAYAAALSIRPTYVKAIVNKSRVNKLAAAGRSLNDASPALEQDEPVESLAPSEPVAPPPLPELPTVFPGDLGERVDVEMREVRPVETNPAGSETKTPGDDVSGVDAKPEEVTLHQDESDREGCSQ
jgi:tetratricopeptide (TPR) repeat protein